ncbi:MAG TPA: DHH family phosphoesterase [Methanocella sp.]|uniref:DHH family phosphoesterase n=1 Tax=Methanocella sp. TaxID=2052833 RepID=UPI002BDDEABB|nr:DHH family phosphoesterase [Methanocella sp.]HTY90722.1 DHH family phosphoesterase [Methanocella sp.]
MDEKAFYDELEKYENILFLCHKNADVDSFGSAYALAHIFGGTVGVQDSLSTMAEMLSDRLKVAAVIDPDPSKYGITVVVDTSSLVQTGYRTLEKCAVIDHHEPGDLAGTCQFSLIRKASATAEIVHDIYEKSGHPIDADLAFALLLAIVTDTGHFRYAPPHSFEVAARLLEDGGIQFSDVLDFLTQVPGDISCRIATLKAASRMTMIREGDHLVVTSMVSSFGAQSAASLVAIGADVAFVGSDLGREVRVSGRVKKGVALDIAVLLNDVGKKFGGSGGGHAAAAGLVVRGKVDADKVLDACVAEAVKKLKEL